MARNSTPRPLSLLIDDLPEKWWASGLSVSAPGMAPAVAGVRDGRCRSRELPAAIAARVVAGLDPATRAAVLEGETRVSVLAAAGVEVGGDEPSTKKVPAVFRGSVDAVRAKLAKQCSVQLATAVAGLASRSTEDADALVRDVGARLSRYHWGALLGASVRGEIPCAPATVIEALSPMTNSGAWWTGSAWHELGEDVDAATVVSFAEAMVAADIGVPSCAAVTARREELAEAAMHWPLEWRRRVAVPLARAGVGADALGAVCAGLGWPARIEVAVVAEDHEAAAALVDGVPISVLSGLERHECPPLLARVGDRLGVARLAALYSNLARDNGRGFGWSVAGAVLGSAAHSPDSSDVEAALAACSSQVRSVLVVELTKALSPTSSGSVRWWGGELKCSGRLEGPVAEAVLRASGVASRWRLLYDACEQHPATRQVLAGEVVACFERHGLDELGAATFLSMLDGWDGTLDELGAVAALLGDDGPVAQP